MFGRICPAVSCLYIALLVQVPFGSPLRGGIEGGAPNLKILSPPLYSFVSLSGKQIDGNVGTEIKIKYLIKNFLVPTEGVICITPDSLDHSSSSSIFVDDEQVAKSGIVRLSNVQAGTHMIRFDMLAHVITNKGKTGYQSLGHAFAIFEVIPSAVPRFYPPVPRLSLPISPGEECTGANFIQQEIRENDQMSNWFRSLPSFSCMRVLWRNQNPKKKIKIAYVGTFSLDGQKTIWIEQWKKLPKDLFEITYYCFAQQKDTPAPMLPILDELGINVIITELYSISRNTYNSEQFPQNLLALLNEVFERAMQAAPGDATEEDRRDVLRATMSQHSQEGVRLFHSIFISNLEGNDLLIFANSRTTNDLLLIEAARMANVPARIMDLPNLYPVVRHDQAITAFVAPSYFVKGHFSTKHLNGPCIVINPGVPTTLPAGRKRSNLGDDTLTANVGFIGRMQPEKSPGIFLYAAKILNRRLKRQGLGRARFFMIGDGELRKGMEIIARDIGLGQDEVTFLGWVDHDRMSEVLDSLDVVVQTSLRDSETFGISNIEAMGRGIPVISFGIGGSLEYSLNGTTGYVVDKPAPSDVAVSLQRLLTDANLYEKMSEASVNLVKSRFLMDHMVEKYMQLYIGLLLNVH
jgi:glycosyltransferase involved in cell wall biosynthesis